MTGRLSLNEDVYFCVTQGQGIFLDLKRDEYNAIPVATRTGVGDDISEEDVLRAFEQHRCELLEERLLADRDDGPTSIAAYKSIPRSSENVFHPDDQRAFGLPGPAGRSVRVDASDVLDFGLACQRASAELKERHIRDVVVRVRTRKAAACSSTANLNAMRLQTAIFCKLRPWYPRGYLCLYDALALVEFLARRRLYPLWVFGVQAQPFGAHCWVQAGDCLLNEATEYAGQFTPIMAV
ncbi:MAG: lasso peptide biosynthesis B2 protein [Hyphomonadaceae bacterium]|nr:lasso peptide biosynthesis B2 protein [Hyphomonadaceae bacterium]